MQSSATWTTRESGWPGNWNSSDEAKTQKAAALITEHFGRLWAWDQQVREKLDAAWAAWDAARDNSNGKAEG